MLLTPEWKMVRQEQTNTDAVRTIWHIGFRLLLSICSCAVWIWTETISLTDKAGSFMVRAWLKLEWRFIEVFCSQRQNISCKNKKASVVCRTGTLQRSWFVPHSWMLWYSTQEMFSSRKFILLYWITRLDKYEKVLQRLRSLHAIKYLLVLS